MNKVTLIGRITKDPDLRFTAGKGTAVCTFTIAVRRRGRNAEGRTEADFIPIVVWGKQGENVANYMTKGKLIAVSGRIQTRNYVNKEGNRRYITEVIAEEVEFLERIDNNNMQHQNPRANMSENTTQSPIQPDLDPWSNAEVLSDDEIPF